MSKRVIIVLLGICSVCAFAEEHAYPAFSPDGKWIAFSSDRHGNHDLFIAGSDGKAILTLVKRSGTQTQPAWSPDGKQIAYIHRAWNPDSRSVLMIVPSEGGTPSRVGEFRAVTFPHWATDGRIYFSMRVDGYADIFSVLPTGEDPVNHTMTPAVDEGNVNVMHDRMAYDLPDGDDYVIEIRSTGAGSKRVLRDGVIHWDPHWLPDGNLLIGVYASADATLSRLVEFDPQGREIREWTPAGFNVFWPTVSPDGSRVVFSYSDEDFGVGTLHELDFSEGIIREFLILSESP